LRIANFALSLILFPKWTRGNGTTAIMRPPALADVPISAYELYHLVTPHEWRQNFLCRNETRAEIRIRIRIDIIIIIIIIITVFFICNIFIDDLESDRLLA